MAFPRTILLAAVAITLAPLGFAQEDRLEPRRPAIERRDSHFLLRRDQPLREAERTDLQKQGFRVLRAAGGNDYVVRGPRTAAIEHGTLLEFVPADKIRRSALRELAAARSASRLRLTFHDDVSFAEARELIESAGGRIADPLATDLDFMRMIDVIVPDSGVDRIAEADSVFRVSGPRPKIAPDNANAATLSSVPPLYAAPYELSGKDVVVSLWDCGNAQGDHIEYNGRMTLHDEVSVADHPTHVAGTIGATGINTQAKGMAPAVTMHQYDVGCPSGRPFLVAKNEAFPSLGIRADNNSWSFIIGWRRESSGSWTWYDGQELFGSYLEESAGLDRIARVHSTLMMFSAGNDADDNGPTNPPFSHRHDEDETNTYCASTNGSGTDCPAAPECNVCEPARHPSDGPFTAVGPLASSKNVLAVGAVGSTKFVTGFSSRGPALDGRVKPDVVAKGLNVFSSLPTNTYGPNQGTSMSSPVVTGVAALLIEQWRKTMGSPDPVGATLRALIVAGAEDIGNAGPDYVYGFGLVNAKNSADMIRDDNRTGSRIRSDSVQQGAKYQIPITVPAGDVRLTLVWDDPEAVPEAQTALVNDLDMRLIASGGDATLPYVLDVNNFEAVATRGTNRVDNTEQIELKGAAAGVYMVEVSGARVGGAGQEFTLVGSGQFGTPVVICTDVYEPNESEAAAYGPLARNEEITARTCSAGDLDFFRIVANETGPVSIVVRATDTPVRASLTGGAAPVTVDIQPGQSSTLVTALGSGSGVVVPAATFLVRIAPLAEPGSSAVYTVKSSFGFSAGRRRGASR